MKVPSPQEIGLPEKFDSWRPCQEEAMSVMITRKGKERAKTFCMPTGSGKSAFYVGYAMYSKEPTCFVTESKGLQSQLLDEFGSIGMVSLMGKSNYQCQMRPDFNCELGAAARCPYKGSMSCPNSKAESEAAISPLVTTNYAKWTSSKKFGQGMQHFKQVVFDEGHKAPDAIANAMHIELHSHEIEDLLGLSFVPAPQDQRMDYWKKWAGIAKGYADDEARRTDRKIQDAKEAAKPSWVRHLMHMNNLSKWLSIIALCNPANWVCDTMEDGYKFDPIRPGRYGETTLLLGIPSVITVSGTIVPKTMYMMGMPTKDFYFQEFDSEFDPADGPIYHVPTMLVDSRHPDTSMLWVRLDQWAGLHRGRSGIVHTISYGRREEIMRRSSHAASMIFNDRGEPSTSIVEEYKSSRRGTILVGPTFGTGFDFPGKECEWQFICKVPFEPPSKIVQARNEDDKEYRGYRAINTLVQACGRGNRYKGDRCSTLIPDDNLVKWVLKSYGHFAPRSWHRAFRSVYQLPKPLPAL